CYYVLCARIGALLPGERTLTDRLVSRRFDYIDALEAADAAWRRNTLDVSMMRTLISELVRDQLFDATGIKLPPS
ncbi:MAG TPA: hypothetical protein VML75_01375, partial [Kofleriaceae bacterium]|nr:hypothetical protein [Kofleriaceae bacterium]